jgi:hypothetical protein
VIENYLNIDKVPGDGIGELLLIFFQENLFLEQEHRFWLIFWSRLCFILPALHQVGRLLISFQTSLCNKYELAEKLEASKARRNNVIRAAESVQLQNARFDHGIKVTEIPGNYIPTCRTIYGTGTHSTQYTNQSEDPTKFSFFLKERKARVFLQFDSLDYNVPKLLCCGSRINTKRTERVIHKVNADNFFTRLQE